MGAQRAGSISPVAEHVHKTRLREMLEDIGEAAHVAGAFIGPTSLAQIFCELITNAFHELAVAWAAIGNLADSFDREVNPVRKLTGVQFSQVHDAALVHAAEIRMRIEDDL
jgi:hypothetical protein